MNILSITGILPIPNVKKANDFLIPLFTSYKSQYPDDNIFIFRLESYRLFSKLNKLLRKYKSYELDGFPVFIQRYFSTWRYANIHSLIASYSSYYFNRKRIHRFLEDHKIDVIHAEYIIPDGYLAYIISKKRNIPYVLSTHRENHYFDSSFSRKMAVKVLRNASFVTPLNYASDALYSKNGAKNIIVVPHGTDERFLNIKPSYNNSGKIKILTVAALLKYKNIDKVLLAIADLKDKHKIHYTIIGSGPERDSLDALIKKTGLEDIVSFVPGLAYEDIPKELCNHDIFILPSYFETFGRVLFEAMAVGLPTICAKNSGIHGYFKEGEEGLSVIHNDVSDIKTKLSILLNNADLRKEMGQKSKKLMHNYTWDKIAVTFHELYVKSIRGILNTDI